ncbi:MAG: M20/M25/M40 family metallo-hydrolase, partial [Bacteroidia bacterium]
MKIIILSLLIVVLSLPGTSAQESPKDHGFYAINENVLKAQVNFLASEWTEGRETGERGAWLSADYIASMLQLYGVVPGGDYSSSGRTYFQQFNLMKTSPGEKQEFSLISTGKNGKRTVEFAYQTDFMVTPSEPSGVLEAPVVFVGYGYRDKEKGWDDFSKKDIEGKFILRIAGLPPSLRNEEDRAASFRSAAAKDEIAMSLGAVGIIEVDPSGNVESRWFEQKDFFNMSTSERGSSRPRVRYSIPGENINQNIPRVSVTVRAANAILAPSGITVMDFVAGKAASGDKGELPANLIVLSTSVKTSLVRVRNVVGYIEGKNRNEVIVLGAHYDHLGLRDGYIYNGADDNASGTAAVLTLAKAISAAGVQPEKSIIFALWTGEEKGLLGSRYYTDYPTVPEENIKMNLNFDMISRYLKDETPDAVTMTYTDTHPLFRKITEENILKYGIKLDVDYQPSDNPPGGSDHRSFVAKGIPVMRFKPGHRAEYHTP